MAGAEGLEPPAFGFGDRRSSQLSYAPASPAHNRTSKGLGAIRFTDREIITQHSRAGQPDLFRSRALINMPGNEKRPDLSQARSLLRIAV